MEDQNRNVTRSGNDSVIDLAHLGLMMQELEVFMNSITDTEIVKEGTSDWQIGPPNNQ
jgi:hypothetical protein